MSESSPKIGVLAGYIVGLAILLFGIYLYMTGWRQIGPLLGSIALSVCYWIPERSKGVIGRLAVGICVSGISSAWLWTIVQDEVSGRREFQTIVPFLVGLAVAVPTALWPFPKMRSAEGRTWVRSVLLTLLLAPVPCGPEGTLLPLLLALIFPPLVMLFLFPGQIALSFLALLGCCEIAQVTYEAYLLRRRVARSVA